MVCLLRHGDRVAGASSVYPAAVQMIGGRHFWMFRSLVDEGLQEQHGALVSATYHALDAERSGGASDPVGLCVLLGEAERLRRPQAEWSDPRMIYAGYLDDGRQVRIAYFSDQVSGMAAPTPEGGWPPPPGYRIVRYDQQSEIGPDAVIEAWTSEGGFGRPEAERRLDELLLVVIAPDGRLAAISTAYLGLNRQLRAMMWHFRALVLSEHRKSNVAVSLAVAGRDRLIERYVTGEDRRGLGVIFEVENEGLKRYFPLGLWLESDFLLIGDTPRGAHVRVHYFPGVVAPPPAGPDHPSEP